MPLAPVEEVVAALRDGRIVIVADDETRENEGDAIVSAVLATPETITWIVNHTSGFICAPMTNAIADRLDLPMMVRDNQDPRGTAYTVSVDATDRLSTGISAADRAHTLNVLADPDSTPALVSRPGHILPLRAVDGGVRQRGGHTEAAVDLMKLAGLPPVAAISEIASPDGTMTRLPGLLELGEREGILVTTVAAIREHLDAHPAACDEAGITEPPAAPRVRFEVETNLRTVHGVFRTRAYRDLLTGDEHVALVADGDGSTPPLVRVHSECLTGEAFGSAQCECGPQLDAALDRVQAEGGAVVYLRGQEGRGIGLIDKLRAYRLQEDGLDTLDANLALGLPVDAREYGAAAAILEDLGFDSVRLLTNNPDKIAQLEAHGVTVAHREPLVVGVGAANQGYLDTKRERMGHLIDRPRAVADTKRRAG
ncbi:GTP cyclohydrolase II [Amnibacterium kyonggiense]|uniref:GTP cyclohydrolase-2 n=1 Tax=Amnibacterium kyonggiense TaxID=595671 RepID=A0A4R7FIS6_9MICO|nr:GTP cyclohydrolase II [Amnibacterium kyonggiense]TDS75038.1 GTP cyclohydrolase II /3,4-dihydroxy-2-butanone 4-phosphate synthase [Amnibacterium kyonggiense]